MSPTRTDDSLARLRHANPVPDPDAVVHLASRTATLDRVLSTPAATAVPRRAPVRRVALAAAATVAAIGGLLVAGEHRSAPERVAVLPALAEELSAPGGILHVAERTVELGPDGEPRGAAHVEESWTLLDDGRFSRFRIGSGPGAEQSATDADGSSDYDAASNTVTVVRHPSPSQPMRIELPVVRMARDAASGELPVLARPVVLGRRTLKVEAGGMTWYIAEDAPELVRREWRLPGGGTQHTDYVAFEVLDATPENRELLKIQAPPDARVVRKQPVDAPEPPRP